MKTVLFSVKDSNNMVISITSVKGNKCIGFLSDKGKSTDIFIKLNMRIVFNLDQIGKNLIKL